MTGKRSYDDGCLAAQALELVGERWSLLVVRELLFGPRRFSNLQAALRTISPNVLTQRLLELAAAGVVIRRRLPAPASLWVYELTPWGLELEQILNALGLWASRSQGLTAGGPISAAAVMLSLRAMSQPLEGGRFDLRVDLGEQSFHLRLGRQRLRVEAWAGGSADAVLGATPEAFDRLVYQTRNLDRAVQSGDIAWQGDPKAFTRLLGLVPTVPTEPRAWGTAPD